MLKMKKIILIMCVLTALLVLVGCTESISREQTKSQEPIVKSESQLQQEILNHSKGHLISNFGQKIFDEAITFSNIDMNFLDNIEVTYNINFEKYINVTERTKWDTVGRITLSYSKEGELLNTWDVIDCVNHPSLCPPFPIRNYEKALEIYNQNCNKEFNRARFSISGKSGGPPYYFVWEFADVESLRNGILVNFATAIDPKTGDILWNEEGTTCNE